MTILIRNLVKNLRIRFLLLNLPDILKVVELQPVDNNVDNLKIFPSLNLSIIIDNLKSELQYLAMAEDVSPSINKNDWWTKHETELPHWSKVLLVQPSSAAAKRVFSLLSNSFTEQQMSSLEDYNIETSIMIQ